MWSVTRENLDKTRKVNVNFSIDKHLYEQFKRVAQKSMRKYSNIAEDSIVDTCNLTAIAVCAGVWVSFLLYDMSLIMATHSGP